MAIRIDYQYTNYDLQTDFNEPVSKESYSFIKSDKKLFIKKKKQLINEFNDNQGMIKIIGFYICAVYLIIGIGIPIMAISGSSVVDDIGKSDAGATIGGIAMIIGFFSLPFGFGYIKGRISLSEYIDSLEKNYEVHSKYIIESKDYESYLSILGVGQKHRR